NQRNQALKGFQDGYYRVLVATDVAARGIHVENIAHVVNYDLPQVPEDFIHRVGRTGRAGARGVASTFATRSERADIGRIERTLSVKLIRKEVPASIQRAARHDAAPVIVMPPAERQQAGKQFRPASGKGGFSPAKSGFAFRSGRRPVRRAV
ncbi:MAG: C-terminal helicase domain-containing protein, partial [Candidatus Solibacter sp.]